MSLFAGTAEEWDSFVRGADGWTVFHLYGWKRVIERTFGHACPFLAARDAEGRLTAVLPLVRVRSRLFGHYLVSMPFVNYGGPLGTVEGVRHLVDEAAEMARRDRVKLLELRSRGELPVDLPASHRKVTVLLDLPSGSATPLWDGLKAKVRSQIRRPQKEGVEVRFGPDQLDGFYHVFAQHMRDLGTPVQSRRLFEGLRDEFPEEIWFGCAYLNGAPVAGGCGFRWADEFEMTWASSLREHNKIAPNMLLYWSFMERCIDAGVRTFNFGRCTPGGNTHRFKLQWGSRDEPLWWYQFPSGAEAATPSPDDAAYSWGPKLWRKLPLPVANVMGPRLVRYIP
jgi:serine/alanine adding enzyme